MTEKRTAPDASAGKGRRKRVAPTIDLTATEVKPEAVADVTPPREPPAQEKPAQAHRESERSAYESTQAVPKSAAMNESAGGTRYPPGFKLTGPVLAAGVAGAATVSVVLFGLWLTGLVPIRYAGSTAMRARVTGMEMQLRDLQKRPAPAADSKAIDALSERVAKMEDDLKNIPANVPAADPALANRVATAENAMKSLGLALTALNRRNDDLAANTAQARARAEAAETAVANLRAGLQEELKTASAGISPADLEPLQKRIAALEKSVQAPRQELAKTIAATSVADNAARLALSAVMLRDVVLRGAPFATELAQAKSLGASSTDLAALAPFAAAGLPSDKTLARELSALLPAMLKASGTRLSSASFIERLQANAGHLVRIRPVDAPPGNDASDVMARIEIATARDDIAAALAEISKLPEAGRQQAANWVMRAQARQKALAAAQQFTDSSARALAKP